MMITATILSSLVAAFTLVPLVTIRLLSRPEPKLFQWINIALRPFTRWMDRRTEGITDITGWLLKPLSQKSCSSCYPVQNFNRKGLRRSAGFVVKIFPRINANCLYFSRTMSVANH